MGWSIPKLRLRVMGFPRGRSSSSMEEGDRSTLRVATTALEYPRRHDEEVAESGGTSSRFVMLFTIIQNRSTIHLPPRYRRHDQSSNQTHVRNENETNNHCNLLISLTFSASAQLPIQKSVDNRLEHEDEVAIMQLNRHIFIRIDSRILDQQ